LPPRHAVGSLGNFVEHLVGSPNSKGWRTQLKLSPTPCKNTPNTQKTNGTQSKNGVVPKTTKKNEENGRNGFFGKIGGKMENRAERRPAVGGMVGERPAVGWGVVGL
jgi:hypothetical protein